MSTYCVFVNILLWQSLIVYLREVFLAFKWNFLYFALFSLPLVRSLGSTEKSSSPSSSFPPHEGFSHIGKIPLSLLLSMLDSPCSLSLSSQEWHCSPLVFFMALCWTLYQDPQVLFYQAAFQLASSSVHWCLLLLLPMCRALPSPLLNFLGFLFAHFSSLWGFL